MELSVPSLKTNNMFPEGEESSGNRCSFKLMKVYDFFEAIRYKESPLIVYRYCSQDWGIQVFESKNLIPDTLQYSAGASNMYGVFIVLQPGIQMSNIIKFQSFCDCLADRSDIFIYLLTLILEVEFENIINPALLINFQKNKFQFLHPLE